MSDNNSIPNQTQNSAVQQPQKKAENTGSRAGTATTTSPKDGAKVAAKPEMKKVDIVIAGVTYQIYCPVDEEAELRSAVYYINNFMLDIKKSAPNLNQENLLVLCCLNLYDKIHSNNKAREANQQKNKHAEALLSKIMQDAKSIL